jgi:hypothetical protein
LILDEFRQTREAMMPGQTQGKAWGGAALKVVTATVISASAIAIANSPILVTAAETPPAILKEERNDPAAGEVMIINPRSTGKAEAGKNGPQRKGPRSTSDETKDGTASKQRARKAPDPYAPRDTVAGPRASAPSRGEAATSGGQPTRRPPAGAASPREEPGSRQTAAPPPPPFQRAPQPDWSARAPGDGSSSTERSRGPAQRYGRDDDSFDAASRPRRGLRDDDDAQAIDRPFRQRLRERDDILHPPPGYRPLAPDWRYAEPAPHRRARERAYYDMPQQRPWRACRRLARACQDGFKRACWRWRRDCR